MFAHAVEYRRERVAIIAIVRDLDRPFVGNSACQFRKEKAHSAPFSRAAVDCPVQTPVQVGQGLLQGNRLAGVLVAQQLQLVRQGLNG